MIRRAHPSEGARRPREAGRRAGRPAGEMPRPIKVTIIGAGSMFSPEISNDLLRIPGGAGGTIALVDVDAERLDLMRRVLERLIEHRGAHQWKVEASTDRTELLPGPTTSSTASRSAASSCVASTTTSRLSTASTSASATPSGPAGCSRRCARSRCGSTCSRRRAALPGRLGAQLHQPDEHDVPGGRAARARCRSSGSATACRAPATSWRSGPVSVRRVEWKCAGHQPPGVVHRARAPTARISTPAHRKGPPRP